MHFLFLNGLLGLTPLWYLVVTAQTYAGRTQYSIWSATRPDGCDPWIGRFGMNGSIINVISGHRTKVFRSELKPFKNPRTEEVTARK